MGQVLHGSATTTEAVRRAIQHSQESVRALAERHGVNPKTVSKWKHRETEADCKTGPKEARSTVLTPEEEAVVVAFRRFCLSMIASMACVGVHYRSRLQVRLRCLSDEAALLPQHASTQDRAVGPRRRPRIHADHRPNESF